MKRSSRITALAAAATVAAALTACSGGDTDADSKITFVGADPAEAFAPLIDAFEAEHPEYTVEYQTIPFDQYNNVIQQRVGSQDPSIDVLLVDAGAAASMASRGWLTDLSDLREEAEATSVQTSVDQSVWDDRLWALPLWTSAQYLYYNVGLLEEAGVEPPTPDGERWTWDQVTDAAARAQSAGAEWGLLFDQTDRYYQLQPLAESLGGGSGATGDDLLTADVTNEGWQQAMEWYGALFADGLAPRGIATDQMNVLFASGDAAFFIGGPWSVEPISKGEPPIEYGVAPVPTFADGTPAMSTGSWSIGVSSATDAPEAAAAFAEFASLDPVGNAAAVEEIVIPPTNTEAFDDYIARLDDSDAPNTEGMGELTLRELQDSAVSRPGTVGFTQMQDVLDRAFADIRNGEPVPETLTAAEEELQGLWDRL